MSKYYIIRNNAQQGPYSIEELKAQYIQKHTLVWHEGLADWQPAIEIPELQRLFIASPPPFKEAVTSETREQNPPPFTATRGEKHGMHPTNRVTKKKLPPLALAGIITGVVLVVTVITFLAQKEREPVTATAAITTPYIADTPAAAMLPQRDTEAEERKRRNDALTVKNMEIRNNWHKYFTAEAYGYKVYNIGGVENLNFSITNHTEYLVDQLDVTAYYYLANGNFHGTNVGTVYNIGPGETVTVKVKDTNRGTRFEHRITKIVGSKFHFLYSESYTSGNPEDPFYY